MTNIGTYILRYLEERDSDTPLSREQICEMLFEQTGKRLHVRDVQDEINLLNAELKKQDRLIVSGPGRRGYWIPKCRERDLKLLDHAANTFDAHADAARERAKEIRSIAYALESKMKQPTYTAAGQAVMFAQL